MSEQNFHEKLAIQYARNLLRNNPKLIQSKVDVGDVFRSLHGRLPLDAKEALIARLTDFPKITKDTLEKVTSGLMNGEHLGIFSSLRFGNFLELAKLLDDALAIAEAELDCEIDTDFTARLDDLAMALRLGTHEVELIKLLYTYNQKAGIFEDAFNEDSIWASKNFRDTLAAFLSIESSKARELLRSDSAIFKLGLIEKDDNGKEALDIQDDILSYLSGAKDAVSFLDALFETVSPEGTISRPINVSENNWKTARSILNGPGGANVIFYGIPGTGKTTLAKALCSDLGMEIIGVRSSKNGDHEQRISNLLCAMNIAEHSQTPRVILVDEADQLLCTRWSWLRHGSKIDKGWLNKTIETTKAKVIWISNSIDGMESSTLRRFSYSIEFNNYTSRQRRELWKSALLETPMIANNLKEEDVVYLSARYQLQPAQITDSLRQIEGLGIESSEQMFMLEQCLASHEYRVHGDSVSKRTNWLRSNSEVSVEGLSADHDLTKVIGTLRCFYDRWEKEGDNLPIRNMNLLLSGPPGTGKTEFAKLVAKDLGRDLLVKTASELMSKWLGETEKNIAKAFGEAEQDRAILFIDEADSFLWPREKAQQSWQVSEVNEFLCRMESFRGILICASNHMDLFDDAAIRRFNLKVRFDWLQPAGKMMFFDRVLGPLLRASGGGEMTQSQKLRLERLPNLAPGDFKVVFQKHAVSAGSSLLIDDLLDELERESKYKLGRAERMIGFST